jgi:site-specific recombinase
MDGDLRTREDRWAAVGTRDRAEIVLLRARLADLARVGPSDEDAPPSLEPLCAVIDRMRREARRGVVAGAGIERAIDLLEHDDELREGVRKYFGRLVRWARTTGALAELGLLPAHGLIAELRERVVGKVLPSHRAPSDLAEIVDTVFCARRDAHWLESIEAPTLARLGRAVMPTDVIARGTLELGALRAIDLLAHRLAAAGEGRVVHEMSLDPPRSDESPFLAQADAILLFTGARRCAITGEPREGGPVDVDHAQVLLRQCREAVAAIRKRAARIGATVRMAYDLEHVEDVLARLALLLETMRDDPERAWVARVEVLRTLVRARAESERLGPLLRRASHLVAAQIVAHAGRTGEHYITRTKREYGRMWLAAAGAGAIVGTLAAIKIGLGALHAPPLVEAALFSANYAIGFIVVQLLGFTIATKQPAMTAAALAGSIDAAHPRDTRGLIDTIVCLVRSQLAAIGGNVAVAGPFAFLLSMLFAVVFGAPIASLEKAHHLVHELHPLRSLAVPHAALTGVWLTLSGIAAGYAANAVIARHVPERVARSSPLRRWLGEARAARVAALSERSTGGIVGCVVLGVLLGSTGTIGQMLGLPIDIRHVSFASANLGHAIATLGWREVDLAASLAGIASIGAANLVVSFGLSLGLAMSARGARLRALPNLARDLGRSLWRDGLAWVLPVGRTSSPLPSPVAAPGG